MSVKYFDKTQNKWIIFPGTMGAPGKSAYEIAVQQGYEGTLDEWMESLKGTDGKDAYTIAVEGGYTGTEEEYNEILSALSDIAKKLEDVDEVPTANSTNLVLSGGVKQAIDDINSKLNDNIKSFIVDNLTTSDPEKALSANQGKILKDLIDNLSTLEFTIVDTLPTTGNSNIIYLVRKAGSSSDIYDEYIYVNTNWEKIGNTAIDLSNYYTIPQVDAIKEGLDNKISTNTENIDNLTTSVNNLTTNGLTTPNILEIQKNGTKILEWNGSEKGVANIEVPDSLSDLNPTQEDIINILGYRPADASSAGSGDVTGPTNSVDSNFAIFSGNNGKIIKDSGYNANSFAAKTHTHSTSDITGLGNLATKDKIDESDLNFTISAGVEVDNSISDTSVNPVQNKVISQALSTKVDNTTLENYYPKNEVYSKSEMDNIIPDITTEVSGTGNVITTIEVDATDTHKLKAAKGLEVYTKQEIDNKLVAAGAGDVVAADQFNAADRIITSNGVGKVVKDSGILISDIATKNYVDNKNISWDNIANKPTSYTPSDHSHTLSEITDVGALASKDKIDESDLNFSLPSGITVDTELNQWSDNPVSNSVITAKFNNTYEKTEVDNLLNSKGDVNASGDLTADTLILGAGDKTIKSSGVKLDSLATKEWVNTQGFAAENTWRPIIAGDTTLNDASTSLTITNGDGIDVTFVDGLLTISNTAKGISYTLPEAKTNALGGIKIGYSANSSNLAVQLNSNQQAYVSLTSDALKAALGYTPANESNIPTIPTELPNPETLTITANSTNNVYNGRAAVDLNLDEYYTRKLPILTNASDAGKPGIYCTNSTSAITINTRVTKDQPDAVVVVPASARVTISGSTANLKDMDALLTSTPGTYKCFCISWVGEGVILVNGALYV